MSRPRDMHYGSDGLVQMRQPSPSFSLFPSAERPFARTVALVVLAAGIVLNTASAQARIDSVSAPRQVHGGCQNVGTVVILKARDTLERLAFWRAGRMLPRLAVK